MGGHGRGTVQPVMIPTQHSLTGSSMSNTDSAESEPIFRAVTPVDEQQYETYVPPCRVVVSIVAFHSHVCGSLCGGQGA
jgi:hypothetical protein